MNTKDLEKRVNKMGGITYWKENVLVGRKCTKCGQDKEISEFYIRDKKKNTYIPECKECMKQYYKDNAEKMKKRKKEYDKQYRENNKEHKKEYMKQYYKDNIEKIKQYRKDNKKHFDEYMKQYCKNNKEHKKEYMKQYNKENAERYKRYYQNNKENNLQEISNILEQISPLFKELNLPIYGYIYKFVNIKTGHIYIGQTTIPLNHRYGNEIINSWIKERKEKQSQKFINELIEEDIQYTEVLDIAFCQYHLDKLEAYYISYYDSYNNGYNNNAGHHNTDNGIEAFKQILMENNLKFINGKIKTLTEASVKE